MANTQTQAANNNTYDRKAFEGLETLYGETSDNRSKALGKLLLKSFSGATDVSSARTAVYKAAQDWGYEELLDLKGGLTQGNDDAKNILKEAVERATGLNMDILEKTLETDDDLDIKTMAKIADHTEKSIKNYALGNVARSLKDKYSLEDLKAYAKDLAKDLGATKIEQELDLKTNKTDFYQPIIALLSQSIEQKRQKEMQAKGLGKIGLEDLLRREAA